MIKPIILFILVHLFLANPVNSQDLPAYKVYTNEGKEVDFQTMFNVASTADIIFFGELHNNPIAHWLQLEMAQSLFKHNNELAIGMEMFEADDQIILDEYMEGKIEERNFVNEAKTWNNYETDYRPLVEFAKKNNLSLIATNIPRRYANLVYRKGLSALDSISVQARQWIAPLPMEVNMELSNYKNISQSMNGHGQNGENLVHAQAIKDATMAHFILKNRKPLNFHINGAYHSQYGQGIIYYVKKIAPDVKVVNIETVEQDDISVLKDDNKNKADYIICIPSNMIKTFKSR